VLFAKNQAFWHPQSFWPLPNVWAGYATGAK